jgi:hypothetical protein
MKKHVIRIVLGLFLGLFLFNSCEKESGGETPVPTITFASDEKAYKVKVGDIVPLNAMVENAVNPIYSWKIKKEGEIGGKIVSTESAYIFVAEELGEYLVNFRVDADNGSDEAQVNISVLEKVPPRITVGATAVAYAGVDKEFVAEADYVEGAAT